MSVRARLTIAAAAAVAVAVALASAVVYVVVRDALRAQVDRGLRGRAHAIEKAKPSVTPSLTAPGKFFVSVPQPLLGGPAGYLQLVGQSGEVARPRDEDVPLPVNERVERVAAGKADAFYQDATVLHTHVRMLTVPLHPGVALQITRPLTEVDRSLSRIRRLLLAITLGGIGSAAILGLLVARAALAPLRRLTRAIERVAQTRNLRERVDANGRDELSRVAAQFNAMLAALEEAARAQRQLVADASHELRTPLTSLRTNIEVLARDEAMSPAERQQLLQDVVEQLGELTAIVGELVELARGERHELPPEDVRLDRLVAEAVERARRNAPHVRFETRLERCTVRGVPSQLERAVGNLLDNAAKWTPAGGVVEVAVRDGEVAVRDHGPGIAAEDLPHVFDRFYRAPTARGLPGSGLGLAIVRQAAEAHGGTVLAEQPPDGGTRMRLRLGEVALRA